MNCYLACQYHCFLWYQLYPHLKWYLTLQILRFCFLVEKKSLVQIQGTPWMQLVLLIPFVAQKRAKIKWTGPSSENNSIAKFTVNPANKCTASRWPRLKISSQPEKKGKTLCKSNPWESCFHLMKSDSISCKLPMWQVGSWTRWSLHLLSNWTIISLFSFLAFPPEPTNWELIHNPSQLNNLAASHYGTSLFGCTYINKLNLAQTQLEHSHLIHAATWLAHSCV